MPKVLPTIALALAVPLAGAAPLCASAPSSSAAVGEAKDACCKRCKAGKPCGDSCIGKDKHCDKPKGCACQG